MEEANGTGKPVTKQFNVDVTDNMLEIRLYWAGKGTTSIPKKGTYGPLISAISACHCRLSISDPFLQILSLLLLLLVLIQLIILSV